MRVIAKEEQIAPSSVSRQIQKIEKKRDDPIFDQMLGEMVTMLHDIQNRYAKASLKEKLMNFQSQIESRVSNAQVEREARRILRRMSEKNCFLLASPELDTAAVFRESKNGGLQRLSVIGREMVHEFSMRDWIEGSSSKRVGRYQISERGRKALKRMMHGEDKPSSAFADQHANYQDKKILEDGKMRRYRVNIAESPIVVLARKKDQRGQAYITHRQLIAGERLREDFEVSQIESSVTQNWDHLATGIGKKKGQYEAPVSPGVEEARKRFNEAMAELGPGLSDIAFRCCCTLEGIEAAERALGWSARSGKVVLRIALTRLAEFYHIPMERDN